MKKTKAQNPSRLNWINLQEDFKIEVRIEIGITANEFLYENITAKFNFEDNTLKLGKVSLSNMQLKRISLMFATDLKTFAEAGGNSQNLTIKKFILTCKTINKTKRKKF